MYITESQMSKLFDFIQNKKKFDAQANSILIHYKIFKGRVHVFSNKQ